MQTARKGQQQSRLANRSSRTRTFRPFAGQGPPQARAVHEQRCEGTHIAPAAGAQRSCWRQRAAEATSRGLALFLAGTQATAAALAFQLAVAVGPAPALLQSPNANIARTVDAALRRSIPAFNADVAAIQRNMEEIAFFLRIPQRKPWGNMASSVQAALAALEDRPKLLNGVPAERLPEGEALLDETQTRLKQLELAVKTQQPDFVGDRVAKVLKAVADLELLQAPGLPFGLPKDYQALPRLVGRATVRLTVEKSDGALAFVDQKQGGLAQQGTIEITLDGYSAPISAGNFAANVQDGLYNNRPVAGTPVSVLVSPDAASATRPPIPLEILPLGEFDPLYRVSLDVRGGELPVLPLSITGAVSMARAGDAEGYLSGDEWFIYKFDKQQAGLAGLSFDEGTFGVFGYVTKGMDIVDKLQSGDVIVSANLVDGADKLVRPEAPDVAAN